ncbi:hypothetical protein BA768_02920 [Chryseobacterium sp. CBo1]|uniref:hypothetical protein n=1 Tax=Chryseobacterium sp. CBo1 TaxID=1869230 RepID=UPI00081087F5|nr:hypothetical protein [Chryseobacterium sp. CBo1]OCK51683.1 hypothetical protein BA768_02920 [Chryseobacterium sp. CBo1]
MRARASIIAKESLDNWEKMHQKMLFSQCLNFLIINKNSKKVVYKESSSENKGFVYCILKDSTISQDVKTQNNRIFTDYKA